MDWWYLVLFKCCADVQQTALYLAHRTSSGSAGQRATCVLVGQGPGHPGWQGRGRPGVNSELVPVPRLLRPVASSPRGSHEN